MRRHGTLNGVWRVELTELATARLGAAIAEINRLLGLEFPNEDSQSALEVVKAHLQRQVDGLNRLKPGDDERVVAGKAGRALQQVSLYLPIMGFVVRSTHVRNAFEAYAPLARLAKRVLGKPTKLVLSSEWEYSPYTYVGWQPLRHYVLIGLPATECSNPLLIPLAAHELGHSVWAARGLDQKYAAETDRLLVERLSTTLWAAHKDLFHLHDPSEITAEQGSFEGLQSLEPVLTWAKKQAEETFCDCFGLRVFGRAYANALAYLLAPKLKTTRSPEYPELSARMQQLRDAAAHRDLDLGNDYLGLILAEKPAFTSDLDPAKAHLLGAADHVCAELFVALRDDADEAFRNAKLPDLDEARVAACLSDLRLGVPPSGARSLTALLNAGWLAFDGLDEMSWARQVKDPGRVLNELVMKAFEILEIETRQSGMARCP